MPFAARSGGSTARDFGHCRRETNVAGVAQNMKDYISINDRLSLIYNVIFQSSRLVRDFRIKSIPINCHVNLLHNREGGSSYFDSDGETFVFSVDDVFSYKVVERRGIIPLGPTVRFPFDGSNLEVALLLGLTGLANAAGENNS